MACSSTFWRTEGGGLCGGTYAFADRAANASAKLKQVEAVLGEEPWFDQEMLATARWTAKYYMCSLAEAMRLFVPGKTSIRRRAIRDEKGKSLIIPMLNA